MIYLIHIINRSSFVARKHRIFDGIQTQREMDGGKNPQAKTERKKEIFEISLWSLRDSAGFWKNRLVPKKVKKICLFVEGSLSF